VTSDIPRATDAAPLLAQGRDADVFALDDTRVLRRFRDPRHRDTADEARVMRHVAEHGYPVPHVHHADGPDLVLERLHGPTLMQAWQRRPWRIGHYARILADLHNRLAAVPAPEWIRAPRALPSNPAGADTGHGRENGGDGGSGSGVLSVLHLDLHPLNVILTPDRGPVVIDWTNAAGGDPAYEIAYTLITIGTADLPNAPARAARGRYLHALRRHCAADPAPWMAAAARARLADRNARPAEIARLRALIARHDDAAPPAAAAGG
jgi:aminoglycoside phosphotransferase (APT) family kinase protein